MAFSPAAVAKYARKAGVDVWGLTDHDEIGGIAAGRAAAAEVGLGFVPGVEISITWANQTVHIVGLRIDETNPALLAGLQATRSGRDARGREISDQLAKAGYPGAYEGALKFVGNPDLMSRTHFARYLIECGAANTISEVFRKFLSEGKPGYVPHRWASLAEAVPGSRRPAAPPSSPIRAATSSARWPRARCSTSSSNWAAPPSKW